MGGGVWYGHQAAAEKDQNGMSCHPRHWPITTLAVVLALNISKLREWRCGLCWEGGEQGSGQGLLPSLSEAFILLCLILPPDCLLLLLSALHFFKKAHTLSVSHCWHRSGLRSVQNVHASFLGLVEPIPNSRGYTVPFHRYLQGTSAGGWAGEVWASGAT